jgi:hypothetical protein
MQENFNPSFEEDKKDSKNQEKENIFSEYEEEILEFQKKLEDIYRIGGRDAFNLIEDLNKIQLKKITQEDFNPSLEEEKKDSKNEEKENIFPEYREKVLKLENDIQCVLTVGGSQEIREDMKRLNNELNSFYDNLNNEEVLGLLESFKLKRDEFYAKKHDFTKEEDCVLFDKIHDDDKIISFISANIKKFKKLDQKSFADKLFKTGRSEELAKCLWAFTELDSSEITKKLLEKNPNAVVQNLSNFESVNHNELASILIERGYIKNLLRHLDKSNLKIENIKEIAKKMIEKGYAEDAYYELGLNKEEREDLFKDIDITKFGKYIYYNTPHAW